MLHVRDVCRVTGPRTASPRAETSVLWVSTGTHWCAVMSSERQPVLCCCCGGVLAVVVPCTSKMSTQRCISSNTCAGTVQCRPRTTCHRQRSQCRLRGESATSAQTRPQLRDDERRLEKRKSINVNHFQKAAFLVTCAHLGSHMQPGIFSKPDAQFESHEKQDCNISNTCTVTPVTVLSRSLATDQKSSQETLAPTSRTMYKFEQ